ncbi:MULTISPECIES: hypothetical protein [Streptomyces]|uniref:hypothetical protein n=1 Tax=Streptomyces TaxID=1883 RepID=UPI0022514BF7|nr:hypothetical protein [Streptomyces sp. NBC_00160]MCX5303722.1 hypothetical protein [Streptomyces sp. NBC_00160]
MTTTVVQDSQWVTTAISAGAVLISSAAAAWITHYFTGRTEQRRQQHADIQEAAKREHKVKLTHEQRIREQVIATSTTISKMLQDFRAKIGEATEAADMLVATLLYDECSADTTTTPCPSSRSCRTWSSGRRPTPSSRLTGSGRRALLKRCRI